MNKQLSISTVLLTSVLVAACSSDSNDDDGGSNVSDVGKRYQVSIVNLTSNQPLSPVAVISHSSEFSAWSIGEAASSGLETMAEGGDNSALITSEISGLDADAVSGAAAIGPGGSDQLSLTASSSAQTYLTVATMLVNTNDAFAGLSRVDVSALPVGGSVTLTAPVYDAGTEANSEDIGTIPGPAAGGEGYNVARDDIDKVSRHTGVVTADDGLASSALNESHRFDNPAVRITITRQ